MGHEATGTVTAIGPDVSGLKPGQNVIINPIITCGYSDCCTRGPTFGDPNPNMPD
jgi:threonine dehydrogenase-like Zn-dependent dehydrogenase